jgi:drug/metabolite transporter (DMT)-like permease
MPAFPGTLLYLAGDYNPFPVTLILSVIAIAVFGIELAIARSSVHPRKWVYFLIAGCLIIGVMLAAWSSYYTLYGPSFAAANPTFHGSADLAYFNFYWSVSRRVNPIIVLVMSAMILVTCILLITQKRRRA